METRVQAKEDSLAQNKDLKKRVHSGKRFSFGKTVQFPDWRIKSDENRTTQLIVSYKEGKKISKLREPKNVYALASKYNKCSINVPRWPTEMKVLSERPQHLDNLPQEPEKFYNSDILGDIPDNLPVLTKPEDGELVYENMFGQTRYFFSARTGGNAVEKLSAKPSDIDSLCFESRFESGNLSKAIKVGPYDYQLWLRTDLYTDKYTQWYYFRVENVQPGKLYRFTIMNLMKSSSLYCCGMKPLMYSEREAREKGIGWRRVGTNIKYYKNELKREDAKGEHSLYSLSWTLVFPHARDRCYFAHCYPYTYTDLQEYLSKLGKDPIRAQYCKQRTLTRTLAGNLVYIMTITSPSKCPAEAKKKRAIVVTARVHPGETNSSWMMKGLLDYLTSDALDAKLLRDTFVFKVVPMLNPDGVIVGNYRCSLSGRDLNRNYKTCLRDAYPSVWHTREMIKRLSQEREIALYCDFHGHSRQQNVFIYGCEDRKNLEQGFKERVFPMMMSKNCKDKFCFKKCKFKVQKSKSGTGRVVMWNLGISNSYTMEATFCGSTLGSRAGEHFTTADFESMGYHLCDTLLDYCDPDLSKYFAILSEVEGHVKSLVLERMKKKGVADPDMKIADVDLDRDYLSETSTSGSDSSVSDGLPMQTIYSSKEEATKKKKKRLKTRKERNRRRTHNWSKESKDKESNNKQVEENELQTAKSTRRVNELSTEAGKNLQSRTSSRRGNVKTPPSPPSPSSHEACKTNKTAEQVTDIKVQNYLKSITDAYGRNRLAASSDGLSIPQLRYTGKQTCFGLAPASPSRSLNGWSVRRQKEEVSDVSDEDENNFIGRYMARQIRLSIHRVDGKKSVTKPDNSELVQKLQRCNAGYKMIATAQSGDWEGHIEEVRTRNDNKNNKGHMGKYCAHHAAMIKKTKEKGGKIVDHNVERNKSSAPTPKITPRHDKVGTENFQQENILKAKQKRMMTETRRTGMSQKDGTKTTGETRSSSDNSFPIVNVKGTKPNDRHNERRLFNFRGVQQTSARAGYNLTREHRNSSSTDNDYFALTDNKDKLNKVVSEAACPSLSENSIAESTQLSSSYRTNSVDNSATVFSAPDDGELSAEQNLPKTEELAKEAVGRLRTKIQNLKSPGRMVSFALNNQLEEVEEDIKKSLLDEYRNFQTRHRGGHTYTMDRNNRKNSREKSHKERDF